MEFLFWLHQAFVLQPLMLLLLMELLVLHEFLNGPWLIVFEVLVGIGHFICLLKLLHFLFFSDLFLLESFGL